MLRKAMIMAAGVGSRLGALTAVVPKPLVPVANIPVADIIVSHLASFGIEHIVANTHYKAEFIEKHYKNNKNFVPVKETELSGTAGGLRKCRFFFEGESDFVVMSGDGLSDVDLKSVYDSHKKSGAIATIVLKKVKTSDIRHYGIVVPDKDGYVTSFQEKPLPEDAKSNLANTGIYIFNYKIFDFISESSFVDFAKDVFPMILASEYKINTYIHNGYWSDIGSVEQYKQSNTDVINGTVKSVKNEIIHSLAGKYICGKTSIKDTSSILCNSVIGENCTIGSNCKIIDSVIWDNVEIKDNVKLVNAIVLPGITVTESGSDIIIEKERVQTAV